LRIEKGLRIGPYTLQEKLGHGAAGIVHKAWHAALDKPVAIKFLPPMHDPLARERFIREGKAMRMLDHPNIVEVLDAGEVQGTPFMVFDHIAGGSVADRLAAGRLRDYDAIWLLDGVAKGLDYAHGRGILHRDVKPANILLMPSGIPVIADFGLARMIDQPGMTGPGMLSGTPAYMSPEQANGENLTPAADQYALAATAYEMLTGQPPFPGETISEVVVALLTKEPERPSALRKVSNPALDAALLRGLNKDATKRWASCRAFTDAVLSALASQALPRTGRRAPAPAPVAPTAAPAQPSTSAPSVDGVSEETLVTIMVNREEAVARGWSVARLLTGVATLGS
jgi:serine/threonine-protein kinase